MPNPFGGGSFDVDGMRALYAVWDTGGVPANVGQFIRIISTKAEDEKVARLALAGMCMAGKCTRREFNKKAILASLIGI